MRRALPGATRRTGRRRLRRITAPAGGAGAGRAARTQRALGHRPRVAGAMAAVVAAVLLGVAGGPVAAGVGGVYAAIGTRAGLGRYRSRLDSIATSVALDAVGGLAADLRAGAAPDRVLAGALPALEPSGVPGVARLAGRVESAWQVAEAVGAPLADLLDRLESDARCLDRVRLAAAAESAGARATTWLLAALPLAGIGVGYLMGVDPLSILLNTRLGAGCAGTAVALQVAGLVLSTRLTRAGEVA